MYGQPEILTERSAKLVRCLSCGCTCRDIGRGRFCVQHVQPADEAAEMLYRAHLAMLQRG